jgi:hypothetical protein
VEWNGMEWYIIKFHCLDLQKTNGMEWNPMEPIPSYTTQSFNFSFLPIWKVSNGMEHQIFNITILPLFYLSLPILKYSYFTYFSTSLFPTCRLWLLISSSLHGSIAYLVLKYSYGLIPLLCSISICFNCIVCVGFCCQWFIVSTF